MWLGLLVLANIWRCIVCSDVNGAFNGNAQWGWHMQSQGPDTIGHYYVKLPEAEQQVRYVADGSGYHSALAVTTNDHHSRFALGERALELHSGIPYQSFGSEIPNETQDISAISNLRNVQSPLDIFLLQTHFPAPSEQILQIIPDQVQHLQYNGPNFYYHDPNYYNNIGKKQKSEANSKNDVRYKESQFASINNKNSDNIEVVRVFKDLNCTKDHHRKKPVKEPVTNKIYQGTVHYNVEPSRNNARTERLYFSIPESTTPKAVTFTEEEGIARLVASTQDLISNEDLLRINHAAEKLVYSNNDDLIKPKQRYKVRSKFIDSKQKVPKSHITVSNENGDIVNTKTEHENDQNFSSNIEYKFKSPIVVAETNNEREQTINNFVSSLVPYMENGYELVGVKNTVDENDFGSSGEDSINNTPRPVGQNYLTPITVALSLLNSNNSTEDYEISESENIPRSVKPKNEKTVVEIQQSIPIEITHINDVEYHQYLDEGRSNNRNSFNVGREIFNQYMSQLSNNRQTIQNNDDSKEDSKTNDNIESSNDYSAVHVAPGAEKSRDTHDNFQHREKSSVIQPIVIEKEVPVTKFVDRFIEKHVPYPEPVEVVKHVDRAVPVPVHYEHIVEKPVEVTKYVDKPYPVEVYKPYPVEVRIPYPVEHKVYVDRPVHIPYPVEKVVEKNYIHPIGVPTPVGIPYGVPVERKVPYLVSIERQVPVAVEVEKPVEKIVHKEIPVPYPVEKKVPYPVPHEVQVPVPYPVEKRVPVPVERIVEKPVTKIVEKHIKVRVPHPVPIEVHVPKPYPVERIVEKKVPYPVHLERIVEKKVPYPVKTYIEKIVEKPVIVTKYVDKPYPVEKRIPYPVEKIVEKRIPYPVEVPVEVKVPYPVERQRPETPYQFEKVDPTVYYTYGLTTGNYNYIPEQKVRTLQQNVNKYRSQQQAESQQHYQTQKPEELQRKYVNYWGNQYASSYTYFNSSEPPSVVNQNYYGPVPNKEYNNAWERNNDRRRTDRELKISNLRIEYGGFKPPLIPSTEIDLDGQPINKDS
ncbi:uncharacterized protein LOC126972988 [Leptidea sinapis]|uniref:uncharacterized protein LOC126972988 n=1 Tax=Leptidea sinapis TaxID=189913 RepID=UPI0021C43C7C|nr:uncharacterized protein LOC126972988 [Leptidea sinapis]